MFSIQNTREFPMIYVIMYISHHLKVKHRKENVTMIKLYFCDIYERFIMCFYGLDFFKEV